MVVTQFKIGFSKLTPKIVSYRDYKKFDNKTFRSDIQNYVFDNTLNSFKNSVFCIFNKHAPLKKKYIRANEAPFMTKELHKAIMKRSKLRNKFRKTKSNEDREKYNK